MYLIDKSATHEVYGGPVGAFRMDWNREAVRFTYAGQVDSSCGEFIVQKLDAMVRGTRSFTVLHDCWDASALDANVRSNLVEWSNRHPRALASVHAVAQSKVVMMSMKVWALTTPGLKIYSARPEFDVLCKKLGLPVNVHMPALTRN